MSSASADDTAQTTSNSQLIDLSIAPASNQSETSLIDLNSQNEIPMNLLPADKHPYWNAAPTGRTAIEDTQQLEYDDQGTNLIADRELVDDDDELEYDGAGSDAQLGFDHQYDSDFSDENENNNADAYDQTTTAKPNSHRGLIKGNITSDGIIDDDFESELGGHEATGFHDSDDADYHLMKKIAEYGIVETCGDDKFGRKIIICSACRLPNENVIRNSEFKTIDAFYDCLLKYILKTFDQYVDMDYVIIYFHHGLRSFNRPSYGWLMKSYMKIDRKYKKNLKALYVVHPTTWIKFLWPLLRSIISAKFSRKVTYINRLRDLAEHIHLDKIRIPIEVQNFDPLIPLELSSKKLQPTTKFHVPLQYILDHEPGEDVPLVIREAVVFLKAHGLEEPGIFRRAALISMVKQVQAKYDQGQPVVYEQYGDVHLAACVLKTFLRNLSEPIMTFRLYAELLGLSALKRPDQIDVVRDLLIEKLPPQNYNVLKYLIEFLNLVSTYSDKNLMTASNLAIVFGPNLAWPEDGQMTTLDSYGLITAFTEILISRYTELFLK